MTNQAKSILLIMPYGGVGGMERLALNFYNYYLSQGYAVKALKIIALPNDIVFFGSNEISLSNIDFSCMGLFRRIVFYCGIPFAIRREIRKNSITHSIAFGDMANVFSSLSFSGEFKVASIHALKSIELLVPSFWNIIFRLAFRSTYIFFDKVVCISEAIKSDLVERCGFMFPAKLDVIHNPHDIDGIVLMSEQSLLSLEDNKIFEQRTIIFLGRLSAQKAPWHILKAFSVLKRSNDLINLIFIGDGDEELIGRLKSLSNNLGIQSYVHFLGRRSNPYPYLKRASILVLSSYYEGTPNVIVEAIALGTPVVTSRCTEGIFELMCLDPSSITSDVSYPIQTEAGLVTPNFYIGSLTMPNDESITVEEYCFADALGRVLSDDGFVSNLMKYRLSLLAKFDLRRVATRYIRDIPK